MKKFAIITIIAIALLACKEEQSTQYSLSYLQKLEIQNDSDWVEITDIDTVDVCISGNLWGSGVVIKSESEYKHYFRESLKDKAWVEGLELYPNLTNCSTEYQTPDIDFESGDLILYRINTGGGPNSNRKIYRNDLLKRYLYIVEIEFTSGGTGKPTTSENSGFGESITIPKLFPDYDFVFDTLLVN